MLVEGMPADARLADNIGGDEGFQTYRADFFFREGAVCRIACATWRGSSSG